MNRPPTEFKRIAAADLRSFGTACLRAAGMSAAHAAQLADLLTNSDLRGVRSHGTRALYGYCCTLRDHAGHRKRPRKRASPSARPATLGITAQRDTTCAAPWRKIA